MELFGANQNLNDPPGKLSSRLVFALSEVRDWPNQYSFGPFGIINGAPIKDPEVKKKKLAAELANGRLAMMSIIGMFFQDGLTGQAWGDWSLYTDSPIRAFESELGVQAPVGFWDPLGMTKDGDVEDFNRRREAELKNGRVAMFATIGWIVPEYYKFPGFLSPSQGIKFADVPNGLAALNKVPTEGWLQIIALGGLYEIVVNQPQSEPGNYGRGFLGITGESIADPAKRTRSLNAELANSRLAMIAIMGMFFQNGVAGTTGGPMWFPGAFETELGVQAPVGFWDPLGFTKDADAATFRRRRQVELKHGRVCMIACIGYIVPEYFKFEGELSPSSGLTFSYVPNGLAAISKIPSSGLVQIIAFAGICELFFLVDDPSRPAGDFANAGTLGIPFAKGIEGEARNKKLSAEIANGRLAMVSIIGMFYQDGLTGSAWGDWALYTDSPLRAFEGELGVQAPLGFFDPLGLSSDGDIASFRRRRSVEIKHGRICMLATMGYITPEITGKFPGTLAPTLGIKFADIPNGLAAISKVPFTGWCQIIAYCGFVEDKAGYDRDCKNGTPGDMGWKPPLLATDIPEVKKRRLNA
jgi:hypothetical protein